VTNTRDACPTSKTVPWLGSMLLCCVLAQPLCAPAATPMARADKVQQQVAAIDARANAGAALRERPLQGFSAEGGRVVAWGTMSAIEKISVEGLGERGRVLLDFYWQRGLLIAAHTRRIEYGANIVELPKDKPAPMTIVEEDWLEFAGDRLLRWRNPERELAVSDASARRRSTELMAQARSFRRLINAPEAPGAAAGSCLWSCASERRGECLRYHCQ
jgi:hypothetical protein